MLSKDQIRALSKYIWKVIAITGEIWESFLPKMWARIFRSATVCCSVPFDSEIVNFPPPSPSLCFGEQNELSAKPQNAQQQTPEYMQVLFYVVDYELMHHFFPSRLNAAWLFASVPLYCHWSCRKAVHNEVLLIPAFDCCFCCSRPLDQVRCWVVTVAYLSRTCGSLCKDHDDCDVAAAGCTECVKGHVGDPFGVCSNVSFLATALLADCILARSAHWICRGWRLTTLSNPFCPFPRFQRAELLPVALPAPAPMVVPAPFLWVNIGACRRLRMYCNWYKVHLVEQCFIAFTSICSWSFLLLYVITVGSKFFCVSGWVCRYVGWER